MGRIKNCGLVVLLKFKFVKLKIKIEEIMKVCVFGYSENPERYSHMATELLHDFDHEVITINPRQEKDLEKLKNLSVDTVTLYVNSQISDKYSRELLNVSARRFIFNPGTYNEALISELNKKKIETVEGCTLVMLKTNQF